MSEFYDKLDQIIPPWLKEEFASRSSFKPMAIFVPDTTMRLSEMFAHAFGETVPRNDRELRDILYVFGMVANRETKRLCNSYAKTAYDALRTTAPNIIVPFPDLIPAPPTAEGDEGK